jgi:hypothetical protein
MSDSTTTLAVPHEEEKLSEDTASIPYDTEIPRRSSDATVVVSPCELHAKDPEKSLQLTLSSPTPSSPEKIPLTDLDAPEVLGFAYSQRRKWLILSVIFIVQCSMNFNASVYANGVPFLQRKFDISAQEARVGQMVFLICYAFGCELWAPWSEELGRWGVLQASLALVNRR